MSRRRRNRSKPNKKTRNKRNQNKNKNKNKKTTNQKKDLFLHDLSTSKIFEKIDSSDEIERETVISTLNDYVVTKKGSILNIFLQKQVPKKLMSHLIDPSISVRISTIGVFLNLVKIEDKRILSILEKRRISSPIIKSLIEYTKIKFKETEKEKEIAWESKQTENTYLANLLILISGLCSNSSVCLFEFTSSKDFLQTLMQLLDFTLFSKEISFCATKCLNVMTDDNPAILESISIIENFDQQIVNYLSLEELPLYLKTYVCSSMYNIYGDEQKILKLVGPHLIESLSLDLFENLDQLVKLFRNSEKMEFQIINENNKSSQINNSENINNIEKNDLEEWARQFEGKKISIELLANICSLNEKDQEKEEKEEEEEEGGGGESEYEEQIVLNNNKLQFLKENKLIEKMMANIKTITDFYFQIEEKNGKDQKFSKIINELFINCLYCLGNMTLFVPLNTFPNLEQTTNFVMSICLDIKNEEEKELLQSALKIVWSVVYNWEDDFNKNNEILLNFLEKVTTLINSCKIEALTCQLINLLGVFLENQNHIFQEEEITHLLKIVFSKLDSDSLKIINESIDFFCTLIQEELIFKLLIQMNAYPIFCDYLKKFQDSFDNVKNFNEFSTQLIEQFAETVENLEMLIEYYFRKK
ncbi:hypothetical protein M0812_05733 [Anaeramoeba flamelloides]|uniref:SYO1-like TPR repeats domain-containing protein n=1 Tax=Anaeramoeba flamelloides TaxID=1746091 RepID=A0AAV8A9U0_9EUKA|nr:hypothetical protein M0812_05733 [Anaeramoeba flamelloides]